MHPYHHEGLQWAEELAACTDEELVARHNQAVGLRCFGLARQMYLGCLMQEILSRSFDSSVLFERDADGKVTAYQLSSKVEIRNADGRRALVGGPDAASRPSVGKKSFHPPLPIAFQPPTMICHDLGNPPRPSN